MCQCIILAKLDNWGHLVSTLKVKMKLDTIKTT